MKASFIILNYNRKDDLLFTLTKTVELLTEKSLNYEIIVVDNCSSDGSVSAVKSSFPGVVIVESEANIGVAGRNLGFAVAKGEYFITLDNDSYIQEGLTESLEYMDQNPQVGILALNVTTGPYLTEPFGWKEGQNILGFLACGAIMKRALYEKIGGYAEWIVVYADEWELSIRCLNAGFVIRYFRNSNVIHRASTINRSSKKTRILSTRNEMAIVYKYFIYKRWKFILRMFLNNLKKAKSLGIKNAYYDALGALEFIKFRKTLEYTPVTKEVQDFFIENYTNTYPVLEFAKKRLNKFFK
jgi:GT2 family glycosyltransferase